MGLIWRFLKIKIRSANKPKCKMALSINSRTENSVSKNEQNKQ